MRKTRKASLGLTLVWILLLIGVLAFAPQAQAAEPTSGNLVSNGDFSGGMYVRVYQ
jgi:hypothetical protein